MTNRATNIHIIGGGISGMIAAITLRKAGYTPTIIEATDRLGGRVKTTIVKGYQLDHGFQVLLTAYPAVAKFLDVDALDLQKFWPGAEIFFNGKKSRLGDPTRNFNLLFPTLLNSAGSLGDKLKILKLNNWVKKQKLSDIFKMPETSTLAYLKEYGFSNKIIDRFFKPFFSGIFLEPDLTTSSRMFLFVYKMFGDGYAALPSEGIGAISKQLAGKIDSSDILLNTKVTSIEKGSIILGDGNKITSDYIIVACDPSYLLSNLKDQDVKWKSCENLYFEVNKQPSNTPIIGLISDKKALINNIFFHNTLKTNSTGTKQLLSVTIVKDHELPEVDLINKVKNDLQKYCKIEGAKFLKRYQIKKALPDLNNLKNDIEPSETQLSNTIFIAGDHILNGSLHAAMVSGEKAASGLINLISN